MPIYEYHCDKCGDFETIQKISDKPLTHCPTCRRKVTKLMSSTSFQLKGSGWYVTDYARKQESGAKPSKKTDEKKADEKPAASDGAAAKTDSGASRSDNASSKAAEATSSADKKSGDKPAA
jgi:putative FmdB family regulatory protein